VFWLLSTGDSPQYECLNVYRGKVLCPDKDVSIVRVPWTALTDRLWTNDTSPVCESTDGPLHRLPWSLHMVAGKGLVCVHRRYAGVHNNQNWERSSRCPPGIQRFDELERLAWSYKTHRRKFQMGEPADLLLYVLRSFRAVWRRNRELLGEQIRAADVGMVGQAMWYRIRLYLWILGVTSQINHTIKRSCFT